MDSWGCGASNRERLKTPSASAQGVAMPAMNNLVARNVPPARKATALGNCYTGFHSGGSAPGMGTFK